MTINIHSQQSLVDLLCLCSVPRVGSRRIRMLISRFSTPDGVFQAPARELMQIEGISKQLALNIKQHDNKVWAEKQISLLAKNGARIIAYWDDDYPPMLKATEDAPIIIYLRGQHQIFSERCIAIVGTRHPSTYGKMIVESLTRDLVRNGFTIVSGLARGIDTIAHQVTVQENGKTAAILGCGVDVMYPPENGKLARDIMVNGALVSEFPMGTRPEPMYFPRRNRIIAGLCAATLVIEAGQKSGALITADHAVEQGRDVFAVPGNINNPNSSGCNRLVQQGAKLITHVNDILEEFTPTEIQARTAPPMDLTAEERQVFDRLSSEPVHIDRLSDLTGMPTSKVLGVLLGLELKNVVKQIVGKHFVRAF